MAFDAQILFRPTPFGDQLHQTGRLVGVELIDDEHPFRLGIGFHDGADVADEIFFGARLPDCGADHPARRHLEVGDQRLRPVADILELLGLRLAGPHRAGGVKPLQRLDAGLLVGADQVNPLLAIIAHPAKNVRLAKSSLPAVPNRLIPVRRIGIESGHFGYREMSRL